MENTLVRNISAKTANNTKHAWLVTLDIIFISVVVGLSVVFKHTPIFDLKTLVFFALATIRLARTISFNEIAEPLRAPFTEVKQDSCGAGSNVHPAGTGLRYVIGSLISCPICTGTWAALTLYTIWTVYPTVGITLIYILAIAGASELLHWGGETLEWAGRAARVYSGHVSPDKE